MLPLTTFEQSKRLKEEGFNLPTSCVWTLEEQYPSEIKDYSSRKEDWNNCKIEFYTGGTSAPTVSEALLWLEDNKGFRFFNGIIYDYPKAEYYVSVKRENESTVAAFYTYNSRLFQSTQLDMALEILISEKPEPPKK